MNSQLIDFFSSLFQTSENKADKPEPMDAGKVYIIFNKIKGGRYKFIPVEKKYGPYAYISLAQLCCNERFLMWIMYGVWCKHCTFKYLGGTFEAQNKILISLVCLAFYNNKKLRCT